MRGVVVGGTHACYGQTRICEPEAVARRWSWVWLLFIAVLAVALITAATVVTLRLAAPLPRASVVIEVPATLVVDPGVAPAIPTPSGGSFALATSVDGTVATHLSTVQRPIGSVAKAMTALVVLSAFPLVPGANGPSLTMTAADVRLYRQAVAQRGSNLRVRAGEVLTERDLLLALLLPSADNIAETLATRVSGKRATFIDRLNATAAGLGMTHTHFTDPSGLSVGTVSTASDLLLLARAVVANAALAELVATQQARLPDGTILHNLDILLGEQPGWLGIKTGWTGAAGGCLLFAARDSYAPDKAVTVWGAVLGQPPLTAPDPAHPELGAAFALARSAAVAALHGYTAVDLARLSLDVTGRISTRWGSAAAIALSAHPSDVVLVHVGAVMHLTSSTIIAVAPLESGATVGRVTGRLSALSITWPVISETSIPGPSWTWKLFST